MVWSCYFVVAGLMVTTVFEDCIEGKHGASDGVEASKPIFSQPRSKVQKSVTNGLYVYFLSSGKSKTNNSGGSENEIEAFYLLRHSVIKDVSIIGVNEE
jgi:hypothetical protein